MKIGIVVSFNSDAREAVLEAVGQACQAISEPVLAVGLAPFICNKIKSMWVYIITVILKT